MMNVNKEELDALRSELTYKRKNVYSCVSEEEIEKISEYAKGYSDLFINVRGVFVVAELKDDVGVATPHQEQFIEEMARCGAIGGVCRSVADVERLVNAAKRRATWWT